MILEFEYQYRSNYRRLVLWYSNYEMFYVGSI